jgi:MoaA/NifB/PqqE/SkfB family radical SAM enzyme
MNMAHSDSSISSLVRSERPRVDIIWNITLVCPWDCMFCCTDAAHVKRKDDYVLIRDRGLDRVIRVPYETTSRTSGTLTMLAEAGVKANQYDIALAERQRSGLELDYPAKLSVLKNLSSYLAKIDFAGGDPLSCYENFLVIKHAAMLFGKENVSVTSTGAGLDRYGFEQIAETIGRFEFTFDEVAEADAVNRPKGYNPSNLRAARRFSALGVRTKAQLPIHTGNCGREEIHRIYASLQNANIEEILLMRTFPVGRGLKKYQAKWMLSRADTVRAIETFRDLEAKYLQPRIRLQCALKHLTPDAGNESNPCDLLRESFGINPRGQLLLSAWATNSVGDPLHDVFVVGDISKDSLADLLSTARVEWLRGRLNENFGHCKIFAFLFSAESAEDALFSNADPLYLPEDSRSQLHQIETRSPDVRTGRD